MTTAEQNIQIAETIRSQIGHGALYMLGSKNLVAVENGLSFRIRGSRKVNYIKIILNSLDLYDIEYGRIHGMKYKVVANDNGLYHDMLCKSIETNTGLYTSL